MIRDLPGQLMLIDCGEPVRRKPTDDELEKALEYNARLVVGKWHKGRPPDGCDNSWDVLKKTVFANAWTRMKHFMHGGKYRIEEFSYLACYFALRDEQRKSVRASNKKTRVEDTPLLDYLERVA